MARDTAMLEDGRPAFRTYGWEPHCISLGRFEPDDDVDHGAASRLGLDVVRRPTGGSGILHGHDVTFCLVLPTPPGPTIDLLYREGASAIARGLALLGVEATCASTSARPHGGPCFATSRGPDLRSEGRKVCGSALRVGRRAWLMHGSVFLEPDWDRTAQVLPGADAAELAAAAVTIAEMRPGTTRGEVEIALAEGIRQELAAAPESSAPAGLRRLPT